MLARFFPSSPAGRVAFLAQFPVVLILLFIFNTAPVLRRHVPDVLYALWFLFIFSFFPLGYRIRTLELALQKLRRPASPVLWAHSLHSTILTAIFFSLSFACTFITLDAVYPVVLFALKLAVCLYMATAVALLIGFMASSADRIISGGGKL